MPRLTFLAGVVLVSLGLVPLMTTSRAADISTSQSSLERRYSTSHSLGESYQFHPRDGWEAVNITNLQYKYSRSLADDLGDLDGPTIPRAHTKRTSKKVSKESTKKTPKAALKAAKTISTANSAGIGLLGSVKAVVDSMKAMGESEPVTITWYTGHDLLNPSCWSTTSWTPTDESMVSAVTLEGWTNRPQCFKFVELCNSPQKCVFVRVVDTCAGCAPGSKHVDLTKAAFSSLADLAEGVLTVQMRPASDPLEGWLENLWGPKA
ncbi:hypothetical protein FOMPIDRAFT_54995 [Fomitopsis schrenkii]|uniref:RlpA-like protein double-psi beta-barrel domain-containing protein n=1 Tax=Fomitopsis schrenkii TaxID=2126942 RepID=S8FWX9_FOMSC|nr:hypothetical protein FOMPIDRAFT_54995 [Fomitopsis schrenkii]